MLSPIDNYFLQNEEPIKNCLQFLREHILKQDENITESWRYGMPFFYYRQKSFVTSGYIKNIVSLTWES